MHTKHYTSWQESIVLGLVWAVVGVIYSTILVAMLALMRQYELGPMGIGLAAACAGAVGALFYGSLRLAFLSTIAALIAAFGYLAVFPMQSISAQTMFMVSGLAGLIVGGHYGQFFKASRVRQATAKALAGLYAGFVAGIPMVVITTQAGAVDIALLAGVLTPLTGVVYVVSMNRMIQVLREQPPPLISGALVGGGVAGCMGVAVWAFAGVIHSTVTGGATEVVRFAWSQLPNAALGGMIGGFIAGVSLAAISMTRLRETEDEAPSPR